MFKTPLIPSTEMFPADSMLTIVDGPVVGSALGGIAMVRSTLALLGLEEKVTLAVNVLLVSPAAVVAAAEVLLVCVGIDVVLPAVVVACNLVQGIAPVTVS